MKIAYYRPLATGRIPDPNLAYCSQTSQNRSPQFFRDFLPHPGPGTWGIPMSEAIDKTPERMWFVMYFMTNTRIFLLIVG